MRFSIEEKCFSLIVTQQPAARDLRAIVAVMNIIVDLERMGDQAKGIAKAVPHITPHPNRTMFPELKQMGHIVEQMLHDSMKAFAKKDIELANQVAHADDKVDGLYARIFTEIMEKMAAVEDVDRIEATYELLRVARELERFGDLATNVAERVIYIVTGRFSEINVNSNSSASH
jgi:phosphate transport system protein